MHTVGLVIGRAALLIGLGAGFCGGLSGCAAPAPRTEPAALTLQAPAYDAFFDHALSTLRRDDFVPDRVDRTQGVIVTHPATSAQFFEFWRADARGPYQLLEASLHTMRRTVRVRLVPLDDAARAAMRPPAASQPAAEPAPAGGLFRLEVLVDKERHTSTERQVTTASAAMGLYSDRTPTFEGLRGRRSARVKWAAAGRDPLLEDYLLERLAQTASATTRVAEARSASAP